MAEKTKKSYRVNVIDILILLLLALIICGTVYYFFFRDGVKNDTAVAVEYVIESDLVPDEFSNLIKKGDRLTCKNGTVSIGEVTAIEYKQSVYTYVDPDTGEQVDNPYPGHVDIYITVKSDAEIADNGYLIDGSIKIFVGTELGYRVPDYSGVGSCISLKTTRGSEK